MLGIPESENVPKINLFKNPFIPLEKKKLLKEGFFQFQTQLNFEKINNHQNNLENTKTAFFEGNVSVMHSGFLVQIQYMHRDGKSEELLKSEEKYRRFFENDLTGDFIATPDGKIIECNPAFAEIYGFSNLEEASKSDIGQFNVNDWENLIKRLKNEQKIQGHQTTHKRPDGKQIHVVSNVVAILDDFGQLIQVKGYIYDDTERKQAEEDLKESEEKYRRLFDEDLTGDFIATPDGKIIECNPAFAEIHGFDNVKETIGSDISQFNPKDWAELIDHLKNEFKIQGYQTWQMRPDGRQIHVVANVIGIFNDSEELIQVKGYVYDDTERKNAEEDLKRSEEKYHLLFDEDLTGDFIATPDGKILDCNPAFATIYGFNNCEMAMQWNISQSNPFDWPYMVTRLKSEGKILGFQSWQRRSDAQRIHVVANLVGILDDSGELTRVKGYVFDDTERKQAEEELNRSINQITAILDSIQDGFIAINNFWDIIYVNRFAANYAGVDPDDILGQNLWKRFPELVGTIYETVFRKSMDNGEIQHFEAHGIRKTGKCFAVTVYPADSSISVYWRDITALEDLK